MARKPNKFQPLPQIIPRTLAFDATPAGYVTATLRRTYKSLWARLRAASLAGKPPTCPVCGWVADKPSQIEGHEVWVPEPPTCFRLERIDYLCFQCHQVIHFD